MNAPCSGAPLTAPHFTTGGLCRWKAINKEGRHVGLDFYDLLIEGDYTNNPVNECNGDFFDNNPELGFWAGRTRPKAGHGLSIGCPGVLDCRAGRWSSDYSVMAWTRAY